MGKFNLDESFNLGKGRKESKKVDKESVSAISVDTEEQVEEVTAGTSVGLTSTRGRKGQKLPTMNMRFTPENYEYLKREGAVRGLSATAFVNWLIETYRANPAHVHYNDDFKDTEGWY